MDCIIKMMQYELSPEGREEIDKARPVLETVENAFQFYLSDTSVQHTPVFYLPRVVPTFENILAKYIIIRFGIFSGRYRLQITKEHLHPDEIPGDTTEAFKEYRKSIAIFNKSGKETKTTLGDARKAFNALAYSLLESANCERFFPDSFSNALICDKSLLPPKRTSLLSKFINDGFLIHKDFNVITDKDVSFVKQRIKSALKDGTINKNSPIMGNVFIIYVNSPRYRSFNSSEVLSKLRQLGYHVQNLFVFRVSEKTYSLRTLVDEKSHFRNIYNGKERADEDFFCFDVTDAMRFTAGICYSDYRMVLEAGDDYDNYFPEVASMLEGFDRRQRMLCNILATCATPKCEQVFLHYLQELDPEFELDSPISIFEYIRNLWRDTIICRIREFVATDNDVAFVLEASTPNEIKDEIQSLFPDKTISFRSPSELIPKKGRIAIPEKKIIVLRYLQCKSYPSSYPNSYDPYIINQGQQLLEFIPEVLFKDLISRSEVNRVKISNSVFDSKYRRDALHWSPSKYSERSFEPQSLNIFGDDEGYDENEATSTGADKVRLETSDGSVSYPIDTEPVVYSLLDGSLHTGILRELVDYPEIKGIQFLSDLERKLDALLDERRKEGNIADSNVREEFSSIYPGFDFSNGEIWKLALKAKIEAVGFDTVINDLSAKLDEKRLEYRLKDWSNTESRTMLPRKRRTRRIVFDYIGVSPYRSYLNTLYSRYLKTIRNSRVTNGLIDDIIRIVVGKEITETYFKTVSRQFEDALELFGISSVEDLETIRAIVEERIVIKNINSITTHDE